MVAWQCFNSDKIGPVATDAMVVYKSCRSHPQPPHVVYGDTRSRTSHRIRSVIVEMGRPHADHQRVWRVWLHKFGFTDGFPQFCRFLIFLGELLHVDPHPAAQLPHSTQKDPSHAAAFTSTF